MLWSKYKFQGSIHMHSTISDTNLEIHKIVYCLIKIKIDENGKICLKLVTRSKNSEIYFIKPKKMSLQITREKT